MSNASPLPLIIFDVDGTLVGGEPNDWQAFGEAYQQVTGTDLDFGLFDRLDDVTGHAVIHAALTEAGEGEPLPVIHCIADTYADLLAARIRQTPTAFFATDGAVELLTELHRRGYDHGIATGDWTKSIALKLDAAGIPWQGLPMATSSDRPTRASTIALTAERAGRPLAETVYVGDGTWDFRATQALGIPFLGTGTKQAALRQAGASFTLPHLHPEAFFPLLDRAWSA